MLPGVYSGQHIFVLSWTLGGNMSTGPKTKGAAPGVPAVRVPLSERDYLEVARLAEADGTSLAGYVRMIVRRHLAALVISGRSAA